LFLLLSLLLQLDFKFRHSLTSNRVEGYLRQTDFRELLDQLSTDDRKQPAHQTVLCLVAMGGARFKTLRCIKLEETLKCRVRDGIIGLRNVV